jgi:uncharacterized protein (TIGR02996 family)
MHPDESALLAAIRAHPDDDTARLVYADWLDEHSQPERAELIRVQVNLARTRGTTESATERREWHTRMRALLHAHSKRWRKELPNIRGVRWGPFERGLVNSFIFDFERYTPDVTLALDSTLEAVPPRAITVYVNSWDIIDPIPEWALFLKWPGLARFGEFAPRFSPNWSSDLERLLSAYELLAAREWGDRPHTLDLRETSVSDDALRALAEVPAARRFPALRLREVSANARRALIARFGDRVRFE